MACTTSDVILLLIESFSISNFFNKQDRNVVCSKILYWPIPPPHVHAECMRPQCGEEAVPGANVEYGRIPKGQYNVKFPPPTLKPVIQNPMRRFEERTGNGAASTARPDRLHHTHIPINPYLPRLKDDAARGATVPTELTYVTYNHHSNLAPADC